MKHDRIYVGLHGRICGIELFRSIVRLLRPSVAAAVFLMSAASMHAATIDRLLSDAERAYRRGSYQLAKNSLLPVRNSVERLQLQDQLIYWDLLANVEDASGKYSDAEIAAARHLALVQQASTAAAVGEVSPECQSLVRLAKIKRELSQFKEACRLYRLALQIPRSGQGNDYLWEAETRLELAKALEQLPQLDEAVREFDAASRAAEAAAKAEGVESGTEKFLQAFAVMRQAFSAHDKAGPGRQAKKALAYLDKLWSDKKIARQFRVELLISAAACCRQKGDSEKPETDNQKSTRDRERRTLEAVLEYTKDKPSTVELASRADATLRLAELADSLEPESITPENRKSTDFYKQAASLYDQIQKAATKRRLDLELGKNPKQTTAAEDESEPSIAEEVECLMRLQLIYTRLSKWDEAIQSTEMLRQLRAEALSSDDPNYYRTLSALGTLYAMKVRSAPPLIDELRNTTNSKKDIQKAQEYLEKAVEFWRRFKPLSTSELSSALSSYAEVCRDAGDFQRADRLLNESVKYEPKHKTDAVAERQWAEFHLNWGVVEAAVGHFVLAQRNYDQARDLIKDLSGADVRERRQLLALIYINKAQLEKSQRHLHEAREFIDIAWNAAHAANFSDEQLVPFKLANASLLIAEVDAEPQIVQQAPSGRKQPVPVDIKSNLSNAVLMTSQITSAAEPYLTTARHLEALAHYRMFERCGGDDAELRTAMDIWNNKVISASPDAPQVPALQVRALNYLVEIALRDVKDKREQALTRVKSNVPDDQKEAVANGIQNLIRQSDEQLMHADRLSASAKELANGSVAYPSVRVQALLGRAHVLRLKSQVHAKKVATKQGGESARERQLADQDTSGAIQALNEAIGVIEMPRAMAAGADVERAAYFAQFVPVFDLLVDLLVEQGKYPEALEVAELRRSRTYQDQLQTSGVDLFATADKEKVEAAKQARKRYYDKLAALRENWSNKESRDKIAGELESLRDKLLSTEYDAKATSVFKRQLMLDRHWSGQPIADGVEWVSQEIGGDEVALLYYVGNEKSYVFACNKKLENGVVAVPLIVTREQATKCALPFSAARDGANVNDRPLHASDIVSLVRNMRDLLEQAMKAQRGGAARRGADKGLELVRSGTFDVSSEPFVTDIVLPPSVRNKVVACSAQHLIVVPDGALHQLPLELLPLDQAHTKYLLDELPPICYAPSLYIYRTLQQDPTDRAAKLTLVSLANPKYAERSNATDPVEDEELSSVGKEYEYLNRAGRFEQLQFSEEESKEVRTAFSGIGPEKTRVIPLLKADASEAKLKQCLRDPSVNFLHLATHGVTEQRYNNLFGALVLATPTQLTSNDDGFLSLYEVYELNLKNCELAVLSACETNCGPESPLEAGSTMARAFICAGSHRVFCSHWDVSDQATSPLVGKFMEKVASDFRDKSTVDYAAALHAAKKSLRNDSNFSEPWLWAPFVLIGPPTGNSAGGERTTITAQRN